MDFRQEKAPRQGRDCPGPRALVDEAKGFPVGRDTGQALEQPCEFIIATHARLAIADMRPFWFRAPPAALSLDLPTRFARSRVL